MLLTKLKQSIKRNGIRGMLRNLDSRFGIGRVEYIMAINWFNPFATFWLNMRALPFLQAIRFPIWVYGTPRFYNLSGMIRFNSKVTSGMIKFNIVRSGSPSLQCLNSEIENEGQIIFNGPGIIGTGNRIFVARGGLLEICSDFKITDMVNIGVMRHVSIGDMTRITHRCQIMDSNYHYVANFSKMIIPNRTHYIKIGNYCWIGNTTTITGGAKITDYTIVCSNSLVNKSINSKPQNSLIGGIPAKLISSGFRKVENKTIHNEVNKYFSENDSSIFAINSEITMDKCSSIS